MVDALTSLMMFAGTTPVDKLNKSNGIGALADAIEPIVTYDITGDLSLEFQYPINGVHFGDIKRRNIVMAKPTKYLRPFPFRIYEIEKRINGMISVKAEDITHDLSGVTVSPFIMEPTDSEEPDEILGTTWRSPDYIYIDEYMAYVLAHCDIPLTQLKYNITINSTEAENVDQIWTTKIPVNSEGYVEIAKPCTLRSMLGTDKETGIIGVFGGMWSYSIDFETGYVNMTLYSMAGEDRGVQILYGKNMTDMTFTENTTELYTGIYPYWYKSSEGLMDLSVDEPDPEESVRGLYQYSDKIPKYRYCVDAYADEPNFADYEISGNYILPVDFSSNFDSMPSSFELWEKATEYILENNIGFPTQSLTVSFVDLSQDDQYRTVAKLEEIRLGDIVHVLYKEMGIQAAMTCTKLLYNVNTGKYTSAELGKAVIYVTDTIAELEMQTVANSDAIKKPKIQHTFVFENVKVSVLAYIYKNKNAKGPLRKTYPYMDAINIPFTIKPYMYVFVDFDPHDTVDEHGNPMLNSKLTGSKKTYIQGNKPYFLFDYVNKEDPSGSAFSVLLKKVEVVYYSD